MLRLRAALADNSAVIQSVLDSPGAAPDMAGYSRQAGEIRGELVRESRRLAVAGQMLASRRVELADAIRQRRSLDRLAQKRSAAEAAEDQRRRQKELDDLHATRGAARPLAIKQETA